MYSELDICVLAPARDPETLAKFREKYAPGFEEGAAEYEFPQYAKEPSFITTDLDTLLDALFKGPEQQYGVYWLPREREDVVSAMAFFTEDGEMILGLAVPEECAEHYLAQLKKDFGANESLVLYEQPPPDTAREFREWAAKGPSDMCEYRKLMQQGPSGV